MSDVAAETPTWTEVCDAIWLTSVVDAVSPHPEIPPPPAPPHKPNPEPVENSDPPPFTPPAEEEEPPPATDPQSYAPPENPETPAHNGHAAAVGDPDLAIRARAPTVLDAPAIIRALRPLHRKTLSGRPEDLVLDEEATAERAVQDGLWFPELKQVSERWLDLTLVIDASPSTALWRSTIVEFEDVLNQLGTFRTIQRRLLDSQWPEDGSAPVPILRTGFHGAPTSGPAELLDPSGRRVVLVLTDGVSDHWREPTFTAALAQWGRLMPTALVQLLPQRLWRRNGMDLRRARVTSTGRAKPNTRWSLHLPDAWLEPDPGALTPPAAVPIPVLELDARWLRRWAALLVGTNNDPVDVPVIFAGEPTITRDASARSESNSESTPPLDQVNSFLSAASPTAYRLATLLAAVPVNLGAAQLIQAELVPDARTEHLAEVLTSTLFRPEPSHTSRSAWSNVSYTVHPRVREVLLSGARRSETARAVRLVAAHLGDQSRTFTNIGEALDAPDSTSDPGGVVEGVDDVVVEEIVMRALSGPYLSRAGRLRSAGTIDPPTSVSKNMSETVELAGPAAQTHLVGPTIEASAATAPTSASTAGSTSALGQYDRPTSLTPNLGFERQPDDAPPVWGTIPPRNPNFTGRIELLDGLSRRLRAGGATAILPSALHGMGGIGKTQTVVEYIYRHLRDYDVVWWIQASHTTQIRAGLTELAQALRLPGGGEANTAVPAVLEALRRGHPFRRWLLVFDAAESPEAVRQFFPTNGPGEILVTSRNPDWASIARPLEVSTFDRDESVELLRRRGPDISDTDADRLADTLGDLPLAIEQAAAWRAETGMPVAEYLRLFDEKVAEILDTTAPADYEVSVAAAWNVSFDELRTRSPAAHQLLQVCAFFSPEPISRNLFTGTRGISIAPQLDDALRDPMQLSRAIRDINRYGLAKIDHRNDTLQLHRLVQLVLRNRMSPEQYSEMRHGAHLLLANYDPTDPGSPKNWQRYQDVLSHAYAADLIECSDRWSRQLVINLMKFLYRWGDHDEAVALAERAHHRWVDDLGEKDPQTLEVAIELGYYYWIVGKFAEARELNQKTYNIRKETDGENNEATLTAELAVAADLRTQGKFTGSAGLTADVLARTKSLYGDEDPVTLNAARNHGISLRLVGQFRDAAALDSDTYQRQVTILGYDNPETLSSLSGLILDRREAGEYVWASDEQEKLALRAEEIHGENSADTLRRFAYLAVARRKAGDHDGALELSTRVLDRFTTRYGLDNLNAMACALGRSIDLRHAGDLRSARALGEETFERYRGRLGDTHPYTLCAKTDLAVTLRLLGDAAAARELDERALEVLRDELGWDHVFSIVCSINLASDLAALGEAEAALGINSDALERSERVLGADHPTSLAVGLNLVLDQRALGRDEEGKQRYADTLAGYRKVLGQRHPATIAAGHGVRADCDMDPLPM
ncbi:MAG TPA: FxSxx-COOH system tetratricopeptide repeat protein [Pseudonocardiaceae bacterium]|nr:FxSxx-COOH system tetratricopeptide repeat protein [Pseudonocardiaceae bacterium]